MRVRWVRAEKLYPHGSRTLMTLSEYQIRAARSQHKPYKLSDGQGLALCSSIRTAAACSACGIDSAGARE